MFPFQTVQQARVVSRLFTDFSVKQAVLSWFTTALYSVIDIFISPYRYSRKDKSLRLFVPLRNLDELPITTGKHSNVWSV